MCMHIITLLLGSHMEACGSWFSSHLVGSGKQTQIIRFYLLNPSSLWAKNFF